MPATSSCATVSCSELPSMLNSQVFITNDSSIVVQQNVKRIGIAVIAIVGFRNRNQDLRPLIPRILQEVTSIQPGQVVTIARDAAT